MQCWLAVSTMATGLATTRTMILRLFIPLTRLAVTPASSIAAHRQMPRESRMKTSDETHELRVVTNWDGPLNLQGGVFFEDFEILHIGDFNYQAPIDAL